MELTKSSDILKTDIRKVANTHKIPWASRKGNLVLVGDSANATAPNLAQGAGLAIESAWDFVSLVDHSTKKGLSEYVAKRKKRAKTVQDLADTIAWAGQLSQPFSTIRDTVMHQSVEIMPGF